MSTKQHYDEDFKRTLVELYHIDFRSHDYRHTIATDLYDSGAGLPTTREFVGHKDENMTKKYIDHRPSKIDRLQQQYFSENDL